MRTPRSGANISSMRIRPCPSARQRVPLPEPSGAATLSVDLGALVANWRLLAAQGSGAECAAVVKADAYGVGAEPAVRSLAAAGCRTFFVANASEGERIRAVAPRAIVYVLEGLPRGGARALAAARLRPVLASLEEIREWGAFGRSVGRRLPAALQLDTGMNWSRPRAARGRPGGGGGAGCRADAGDEPFHLRAMAGRSAQCAPDRRLRGGDAVLSGCPCLALQLLRDFPGREAASRSATPGLCALWRQSDALGAQSDAAGRAAGGAHSGRARDRGRRERRL